MARVPLNQVDLGFELSVEAGENLKIIDLARCLSLMNRKMYRSGMVYSIDGISVACPNSVTNEFEVWKIPEIYNVSASYRLAFETWREQRAEAAVDIGDSPSPMGRWSDFKLFYNENHLAGDYDEVYPEGIDAGAWAAITGGEWNRADIVFYDAANAVHTMPIGMLGADNTPTYGGVIEAWGDTRTGVMTPDPLLPDAFSESWIGHTGPAAEALEEPVQVLIADENDFPPYQFEADPTQDPKYTGASIATDGVPHSVQLVNSVNQNTHISGGLFPLGFIVFKYFGLETSQMKLIVHVSRGEYKGVAALPLGDFS
jgi:hypothetical protein